MKVNANSLRKGDVIEYQNRNWIILKREHVQPGKGGAYIQLEMKDIINSTKTNVRLHSSADVEKAHLEQKKFEYLYSTQDEIVAMDMESYDQINLSKALLGESLAFLQEHMEVSVEYCNNDPIAVHLPETVILTVEQAEAVIKGQTATASYKPAILENGVRVMVPPFVEAGDKIVVRTEDATYVERAKN